MKTADEFFSTPPTNPVQWADRSSRAAPTASAPLPIKLPEGSMLPSDPEIRQGLTEIAEKYKLNPALLMAMAQQESGFDPNAVGPETKWGQAKGMFQFLDSTAQGHGIDPLDWRQAADAAARDLAREIATNGVDWAVAHHHAGPNPKQHGPKTSRYTQEVLAKAGAIARELGIDFQLPDSAKADFSNVTGGVVRPTADEFFSSETPADEPSDAPSSDGPEDLRTTVNRVIAEAAPLTPQGMFPAPEMGIRAVGRTIQRGWAGIQNALNRETETVQRTEDELRRLWETEGSRSRAVTEYGLSYEDWARQNREVRVSAKPFAQEEAEWAERLKNNPDDAYLLPKRLSHLRPQADDSNFAPANTFQGIAQRFISNAKNPLDLFLQDSIPADLVTALFSAPELERKKFDQARQVAQAFDIVGDPNERSQEEIEMAEQVIGDWRRQTDQTIADAWSEMWQAAKEDPAGVGVGFYEALAADPYMLAAPAGTGVIRPMRAINAARVAARGIPRSSIARRAETIIDRFADAGTLAASLNVAAGAADNLSMEGRISDPEVKLNAAMGYALGGPTGVIFMRGARARAKGLDRAKLEGTLEETLRDMAKADVEMEAQATDIYRRYADGYGVGDQQTPMQTQIADMLGIQRHKDAEAWKRQRRKEIKEAFGDNPEYADYQRFVAEERIARAQQLSDEAEAKRRSAADAAYGRSVEDDAVRRQRWQDEYDAAIEARNAAQESDLIEAARAEDAAWEAAQKLNADELFYAELSMDHPTIRQVEAKIKRRNDQLGRPKGEWGAADPRVLAAMGITAAGATAGAAMFPREPEKGLVAGAMLTGLGVLGIGRARGSASGGVRSVLSQQGAIKPKGGNWATGSADNLAPRLTGRKFDHSLKMTQRYLNRYAGTKDDPLKDVYLLDGTRWEDAMDNSIGRTGDRNQFGEYEYGFLRDRGMVEIRRSARPVWSQDINKIQSFMYHVGDYLRTLPESEVLKMDFVRMVKETIRWDEANAKKMESAQVKLFKDAEVLKEYDDGFKWIRLNKPGQFANESDLMGHSVRGYEPTQKKDSHIYDHDYGLIEPGQPGHPEWIPEAVGGDADYGYGGWDAIKSDEARVYSLRNAKGKPVATVELGKDRGEWYVAQIKGPRNESVKSAYAGKVDDILDLFANDLDSINTGDLSDIQGSRWRKKLSARWEPSAGKASPEMLTRLGIVAGGATAATIAFPEDQKLQGAFLGGLAGLLVPGVGGSVLSRMRQAGAISSDGDIISALVRRGKMANKLEEVEIKTRDDAWVESARLGDQQAFKDLYETYHGEINRYVKYKIGGAEAQLRVDADDITQELFLQAFQRLQNDPEFTFDSFPAYIKGRVEGRIANAWRDRQTIKRGGAEEIQESQHYREDLYEGDQGSNRSIMDETTGVDDYSGETIIDNVQETPESVAIRNDMLDIIRQELDAMPEQPRKLFTMVHLEHYTPAEAAAALGVKRDTAYKAVQRAEQKIKNALAQNRRKFGEEVPEGSIRGPRNQRGSVSAEDLQKFATVSALAAAGGTAGFFMSDGDIWKTSVSALLAPPAALFATGRMKGGAGNIIKGNLKGTNRAAAALRKVDRRLHDMSPELYGLASKHGKIELQAIKNYNMAVAPFINIFGKLPKDIKPIIVKALSTRDKRIINKMLEQAGGRKFVEAFDEVRKTLDAIEDQLVGYGLIKKSEKDYFPFRVKDLEGLKKALGQEATAEIDAALEKAQRVLNKKEQGRPLSQIEKDIIINKVLEPYLGKPLSAHTPGFAKARTIQVVDEKLQPYYHDPIATLNSYGVQAIKYIERAKFFGRHLKKTKNDQGNYAVNIGDSIGEMVNDLKNSGKLTDDQAFELAAMLQDRFNGGEMASAEIVQGAKNITNAALLGQFKSALTQLGDIPIQAIRHGPVASVRAIRRQLFRDKLTDLRNFGIDDYIGHEFLSDNWTRKVADTSFKYAGFRAIDHMGKNFALNASIEKMMAEARSPKGLLRLAERFQREFPDDFDSAVNALKKGQVNEAVELMAFSELTRTQPITAWQLPQYYHRMPNGRMVYHLQTFNLQIVNLIYEDGLRQMGRGLANGNAKQFAKGFKDLLTMTATLGVSGVAVGKLKQLVENLISGKDDPIELSPEEIPLEALGAMGMSIYDYNRLRDSGPAGIVEGKMPPIVRMSAQVWEDPNRSVAFIPVAGRVLYDREREHFEDRRRERRKKHGYKMEINIPPSDSTSTDRRRTSRRTNRRRDDRRR